MDIQDKTKEELKKELSELQKEFYYLNAIKDIDTAKRIQLEQELAVALQEIAYQNEEKEKRAAELIIANLELKFQSEEKAKRAAELVIANIELVFQNKEKAKRAAELIIANKELAFQNEEKAKRAAELIIANKELSFQNEEKAKRAAELVFALEKVESSKIEAIERVKELNGLFSLGLLTEKFVKLEDIYNEFVSIVVPNSMQFPERVFVELELGSRKYCNIENHNLSSINKSLFTPIILFGKPSGTLTVSYRENLPFIEIHEQYLLNAFGERISKITERISTLQELEKERERAIDFENKFKQIAENIDEVFWLRTDSEMIYVSPSFEKIWGVPCQAIYENPQIFTEKIHPEDKPVVQEIFQSNEFKEKGLFNYEYRIIRADNQERWINTKTVPIVDDSGQILKRVGIASDITEKHQTVQELIQAKEKAEKSERKFRSYIENEPDGIFVVDNSGRYIEINNSTVRILGYSEHEILNLTINDLLADESREEGLAHFKNLIETGHANSDLLHKHKNGTKRWLTINAVKVSAENFIGFAKDITERKQTDEELIQAKEHAEESDRLKSAFLANMSHEIRTPMNGILGFSELLKEPGLTGEQQQKYIRIIEKSGARMLNIINDIIDISKIEANLMDVDIKETDINEKIEFIYIFFKPQVEEKGMQLLFKNTLPTKEAIIRTDSEKVYSILTNLVKNAIKFSKVGTIEFGYIKRDETLEFFVKDTGIGIPKDRQEAIFERFIHADITDKMALQGAGLGLSISKAYVEMLGGKIWVESEEGIGSTFYFTLPYNAEPEEKNDVGNIVPAQEEKNTINPEVSGLKILIVEDDEASEMLITIDVEKFSKNILKARTGNEAVEVSRNNPDIDLILMDILMPVMNGHEATRQIRQFNKDVVIIAQTAFGLSGDREKAIKAGCNDYISKPINKNKLLTLMQKYFKK